MTIILIFIITVAGGILMYVYSEKQKKQRKQYELQKTRELEEQRLQIKRENSQHLATIKQQRLEEIASFHQKVFPIVNNDANIGDIWSHWPCELHDTDCQLREQISSLYEVAPIILRCDGKSPYAFFADCDLKIYRADLLSCTCSKFENTKKPCKHIYRLFRELTVENWKSETENSFSTIENIFETLSDDCKNHFIYTLPIGKNGGDRFLNDYVREEINAGLLKASDNINYEPLLSDMTKDQIILSLAKKGITGYRPSWTKVALISWVIDNQKDFCKKKFEDYAYIEFAEGVYEWKESVLQAKKAITISHPLSVEKVLSEKS